MHNERIAFNKIKTNIDEDKAEYTYESVKNNAFVRFLGNFILIYK